MLAKTHMAFALAATSVPLFIIPHHLEATSLYALYGGVMFGAIFPDIDEPHSKIGRKFVVISNLINSIFGHRGFTHTLVFVLVLGTLSVILASFDNIRQILSLSPETAFLSVTGFLLGNILHIVGDMMTLSGVAILYPFKKKSYHLLPKSLRFKTGGSVDNAVAFICILIFSVANYEAIVLLSNVPKVY